MRKKKKKKNESCSLRDKCLKSRLKLGNFLSMVFDLKIHSPPLLNNNNTRSIIFADHIGIKCLIHKSRIIKYKQLIYFCCCFTTIKSLIQTISCLSITKPVIAIVWSISTYLKSSNPIWSITLKIIIFEVERPNQVATSKVKKCQRNSRNPLTKTTQKRG